MTTQRNFANLLETLDHYPSIKHRGKPGRVPISWHEAKVAFYDVTIVKSVQPQRPKPLETLIKCA